METPSRAIAFGTSLLIAAALLRVLQATGQPVGIAGRPNLPVQSNNDAISPNPNSIELTTKQLAVFKKILPHSPRQILVFYSTPNDAAAKDARLAGEKLGISVISRCVETLSQLNAELGRMNNGEVDGILHIPDNWIDGHVDLIFHEAREKKIPIMTFAEAYVVRGALAAYNLRRSEPAAARYRLILNLETARKIGITFPAQALRRADEIIEHD